MLLWYNFIERIWISIVLKMDTIKDPPPVFPFTGSVTTKSNRVVIMLLLDKHLGLSATLSALVGMDFLFHNPDAYVGIIQQQ